MCRCARWAAEACAPAALWWFGTTDLSRRHADLCARANDTYQGGEARERAAWLSGLLARELDRRGVVVASSRYRRDDKGRRRVR